MTQKKINLDLSTLWENPENYFTVRFNDINEKSKENLAQRIKMLAPQYNIRKESGPSTALIYQVLSEINPIIFSETTSSNIWDTPFGRSSSRTLTGYYFTKLCQIIYKTLCTKKGLKREDLITTTLITSMDYNKGRELVRTLGTQQRDTSRRTLLSSDTNRTPSNIIEIGMTEIGNARSRATAYGATAVPEEMRPSNEHLLEPEEETEEELY